VDEPDFNTGDG